MDEAAGRSRRRVIAFIALVRGVVGAGEVGRAADHFRHRRRSGFEREFGRLAGGDVLRRRRRASPSARATASSSACAAGRRACGARTRRACSASSAASRFVQSACAALRALRRRRARRRGCRPGSRTARGVQPSFSRAPLISSAPSGEPCADALPALVGAPKPMVVLQAISTGLSDALRLRRAPRRSPPGSWPSMREACPAGGLEALHLVDASRTSDSAPSIEMPLSSNSTISLLSFRWPASAIASWLMPSIRSPSEAST